jgi:L-asparaginase II
MALKIDDGASRAAETAIAFVLDCMGLLGEDKAARAILDAPVLNTRNETVGTRRVSEMLARSALR